MSEICSTDGALRLDRWLWAARWFKTRRLAGDAVQRGHVLVGGQPAKASRLVRVGDVLTIERRPYRFDIEVRGLQLKRLAAPLARQLYEEVEESRRAREALREQLQRESLGVLRYAGKGRPSKKEARKLADLHRRLHGE